MHHQRTNRFRNYASETAIPCSVSGHSIKRTRGEFFHSASVWAHSYPCEARASRAQREHTARVPGLAARGRAPSGPSRLIITVGSRRCVPPSSGARQGLHVSREGPPTDSLGESIAAAGCSRQRHSFFLQRTRRGYAGRCSRAGLSRDTRAGRTPSDRTCSGSAANESFLSPEP